MDACDFIALGFFSENGLGQTHEKRGLSGPAETKIRLDRLLVATKNRFLNDGNVRDFWQAYRGKSFRESALEPDRNLKTSNYLGIAYQTRSMQHPPSRRQPKYKQKGLGKIISMSEWFFPPFESGSVTTLN
jgi:hypothetical protein